MRRFSLTILVLISLLNCFGQVNTNKDSLPANVSTDFIVMLLGTGMPQPLMERFGPSILVQVGSETLLFDEGRGCLQRLRQLNVSYEKLMRCS